MSMMKRLARDFMTSGIHEDGDVELTRKVMIINLVSVIAIANLIPLGILALVQGNLPLGYCDLVLAIMLIGNILYLRRSRQFRIASYFGIASTGLLLIFLFLTGGQNHTGHLWYYTFPLFASFLLGSKRGALATFILLLPVLVLFTVDISSPCLATYAEDFKIRFIPSFLVVLGLSYAFEKTREETQQKLTLKNLALQVSVEQLKEAGGQLQEARDGLEQRVTERTAELTRTNEQLRKEIRERQRAEQALQESHDKLEETLTTLKNTQAQMIQSGKMASIGQLAAGVAHEINNPIGFVSSNLTVLADYQNDVGGLLVAYRKLISDLKEQMSENGVPPSIAEQIRHVEERESNVDIDFILEDIPALMKESNEGTERIKEIVRDLKDFAHPGEQELKYADINKNLDSTVNVVWNEVKYKARVTKDYEELPLVLCYPQQLNQVFVNLLVNSVQAMKEMGEIRIATRALNGSVEIKISDTGEGIPEESLSRIFDPFFTSKAVGQGTGLGLNVVHSIIKKHKGAIDVESTVSRGTTFTILIPVDGHR
ncbi:MAG: ATP-binding protein [Thermodesulfobacteriota bacterium]|nr:ATP-binding protein [Thermodesulfobacteriota bacterium]